MRHVSPARVAVAFTGRVYIGLVQLLHDLHVYIVTLGTQGVHTVQAKKNK
jgi:hypothetical protein